MPLPDRLLSIVNESRRVTRCKYCNAPIEFATTQRGKLVPIKPNPFVFRYERNGGGVKFAVIGADNLHFTVCKNRPPKPTKPKPPATAPYQPRSRYLP